MSRITVPRLDSQSVKTVGVDTPRAAGLSPDAFGAGLAKGLTDFGEEGLRQQTQTATYNFLTHLDDTEQVIKNGDPGDEGSEGFLKIFGTEAGQYKDTYLEDFKERAVKAIPQDVPDGVKQQLERMALERHRKLSDEFTQYVSTQEKNANKAATGAVRASILRNIGVNAYNDDRFQEELGKLIHIEEQDVFNNFGENNTAAAEIRESQVGLAVSDAYSKRINAMLLDDPAGAKKFLDDNAGGSVAIQGGTVKKLTQDAVDHFSKTLKPLESKQTGMKVAFELSAGFQGVTDPLLLDGKVESALEQLQKQLGGNPEAYNIAEAQIYQNAAKREKGINIARREAEAPISRTMAQARQDGRIPSLSDFNPEEWSKLVNLYPEKADDILKSITNESRMVLDRQQAKEDRAESKRDRREARQDRDSFKAEAAARKKRQETNYSTLWSDPERLVSADIESMVGLGDLSVDDGSKLLKRRQSYNPDHILSQAKGVDKILKAAKIKPETDEERSVKRYVADKISLSKDIPTSQQVEDFAREALYEVDRGVFSFDKPAYKMTVKDIPKSDIRKITDALQRRGQRVTDTNIISAYVKKQRLAQ